MDLYNLPLTSITGIGDQKAEMLAKLGLHSVGELLEYFPFRYEDFRVKPLTEAVDGDKVTVHATISSEPVLQRYGKNKSRLSCKVASDDILLTAVWFNRAFLKSKLVPGSSIYLTGKWDKRRRQLIVSVSEFENSRKGQAGSLQPVYSISGDVTQQLIKHAIRSAIKQFAGKTEELLPEDIIHRYRLMPRAEALYYIHQPDDVQKVKLARRRFKYEELFLFQLKLQAYRSVSRSKNKGIARSFDMETFRHFIQKLPFTLTGSQKKVIHEILSDLREPYAMNRLLQGDVGSGKTVVAAAALYANFLSGYQGALMVPTEILAEQHEQSLKQLLAPFGIEVGLLTGSTSARQKRDTLAALQMGLIDVVIGTHALIQEHVFFSKLGLVITDEQHRFGVEQRSMLRSKGFDPDVLSMTATPIPRTLAITAFGDMDVSTLDELPSGRKPVNTYWVRPDLLERVMTFLLQELSEGRQGYVICPLIEESDKLDLQNAEELYEKFQAYYQNYNVGLLHGRMASAEKETIMRKFSANEIQILVSTTVVEVGVNVPNASVMIVYNAERFGLSQLHQLRGRVGRGSHQSYCVLIADPKNETGRERLDTMARTNDGFEIARMDMQLRGPGDYFGTKQSGVPEFKIADLLTDYEILEIARSDAANIVQMDDFHTAENFKPLRMFLTRSGILESGILD